MPRAHADWEMHGLPTLNLAPRAGQGAAATDFMDRRPALSLSWRPVSVLLRGAPGPLLNVSSLVCALFNPAIVEKHAIVDVNP
jgi:hypothetical protein